MWVLIQWKLKKKKQSDWCNIKIHSPEMKQAVMKTCQKISTNEKSWTRNILMVLMWNERKINYGETDKSCDAMFYGIINKNRKNKIIQFRRKIITQKFW